MSLKTASCTVNLKRICSFFNVLLIKLYYVIYLNISIHISTYRCLSLKKSFPFWLFSHRFSRDYFHLSLTITHGPIKTFLHTFSPAVFILFCFCFVPFLPFLTYPWALCSHECYFRPRLLSFCPCSSHPVNLSSHLRTVSYHIDLTFISSCSTE